jgi:hypothetical protein
MKLPRNSITFEKTYSHETEGPCDVCGGAVPDDGTHEHAVTVAACMTPYRRASMSGPAEREASRNQREDSPMSKKPVPSCLACGKQGHVSVVGPAPWRPSICLMTERPLHWGKTATRLPSGRCSECGWSNFAYDNGAHLSEDRVRGYRCMNPDCGAIKPERSVPC